MRLGRSRGSFGNRRTLNRIRGIKRALIARQRKNAAQAALAMLRGCAADLVVTVNLCEQVGSIYRSKIIVPEASTKLFWSNDSTTLRW